MLKIDEFRMEMEEPKKIYTEELGRFSKKYDFLDEFTIVEEPDIDTVDYIYHFNNINGTSKENANTTNIPPSSTDLKSTCLSMKM